MYLNVLVTVRVQLHVNIFVHNYLNCAQGIGNTSIEILIILLF